jgi:hypothetical protein
MHFACNQPMDGAGSVDWAGFKTNFSYMVYEFSQKKKHIWSMSFAHDETPIEPKPSHKSHWTRETKGLSPIYNLQLLSKSGFQP